MAGLPDINALLNEQSFRDLDQKKRTQILNNYFATLSSSLDPSDVEQKENFTALREKAYARADVGTFPGDLSATENFSRATTKSFKRMFSDMAYGFTDPEAASRYRETLEKAYETRPGLSEDLGEVSGQIIPSLAATGAAILAPQATTGAVLFRAAQVAAVTPLVLSAGGAANVNMFEHSEITGEEIGTPKRVLNIAGHMAFEMFGEMLGSTLVSKLARGGPTIASKLIPKRVFAASSEVATEVGEAVARRSAKDFAKAVINDEATRTALRIGLGWAELGAIEALEEAATQVGQNFMDKLYRESPTFEGVGRAMKQGMLGGLILGPFAGVANVRVKSYVQAKEQELTGTYLERASSLGMDTEGVSYDGRAIDDGNFQAMRSFFGHLGITLLPVRGLNSKTGNTGVHIPSAEAGMAGVALIDVENATQESILDYVAGHEAFHVAFGRSGASIQELEQLVENNPSFAEYRQKLADIRLSTLDLSQEATDFELHEFFADFVGKEWSKPEFQEALSAKAEVGKESGRFSTKFVKTLRQFANTISNVVSTIESERATTGDTLFDLASTAIRQADSFLDTVDATTDVMLNTGITSVVQAREPTSQAQEAQEPTSQAQEPTSQAQEANEQEKKLPIVVGTKLYFPSHPKYEEYRKKKYYPTVQASRFRRFGKRALQGQNVEIPPGSATVEQYDPMNIDESRDRIVAELNASRDTKPLETLFQSIFNAQDENELAEHVLRGQVLARTFKEQYSATGDEVWLQAARKLSKSIDRAGSVIGRALRMFREFYATNPASINRVTAIKQYYGLLNKDGTLNSAFRQLAHDLDSQLDGVLEQTAQDFEQVLKSKTVDELDVLAAETLEQSKERLTLINLQKASALLGEISSELQFSTDVERRAFVKSVLENAAAYRKRYDRNSNTKASVINEFGKLGIPSAYVEKLFENGGLIDSQIDSVAQLEKASGASTKAKKVRVRRKKKVKSTLEEEIKEIRNRYKGAIKDDGYGYYQLLNTFFKSKGTGVTIDQVLSELRLSEPHLFNEDTTLDDLVEWFNSTALEQVRKETLQEQEADIVVPKSGYLKNQTVEQFNKTLEAGNIFEESEGRSGSALEVPFSVLKNGDIVRVPGNGFYVVVEDANSKTLAGTNGDITVSEEDTLIVTAYARTGSPAYDTAKQAFNSADSAGAQFLENDAFLEENRVPYVKENVRLRRAEKELKKAEKKALREREKELRKAFIEERKAEERAEKSEPSSQVAQRVSANLLRAVGSGGVGSVIKEDAGDIRSIIKDMVRIAEENITVPEAAKNQFEKATDEERLIIALENPELFVEALEDAKAKIQNTVIQRTENDPGKQRVILDALQAYFDYHYKHPYSQKAMRGFVEDELASRAVNYDQAAFLENPASLVDAVVNRMLGELATKTNVQWNSGLEDYLRSDISLYILGKIEEARQKFITRSFSSVASEINSALSVNVKDPAANAEKVIQLLYLNSSTYSRLLSEKRSDIVEALTLKGVSPSLITDLIASVNTDALLKQNVEKLIARELREMQQTFRDLAGRSLRYQRETGARIKDRIAARLGLPSQASQELSGAVERYFEERLRDSAAAELERTLRPKQRSAKRLQFHERLLTLAALGALDSVTYMQEVATFLGMKTLTQEQIDVIAKHSRDIQRAIDVFGSEESNQVKKQVQELQKYLTKQKLIASTATEKFWSRAKFLFYAGSLSGPTTIVQTNVVGSFARSLSTVVESVFSAFAIKKLSAKESRQVMATFFKNLGLALKNESVETLLTGVDVGRISEKFDHVRETEAGVFTGVFRVLDSLKVITRAMGAGDAMFFVAAKRAAAELNIRMEMHNDPSLQLSEAEFEKEVFRRLGLENIDQYREQARNELREFYGKEPSKREVEILAYEKAELSWDDATREFSNNIGAESTFTDAHLRTGQLGSGLASLLQNLRRLVPALTPIVPFTTIVGSVLDASIDYTPVFNLKRLTDKHKAFKDAKLSGAVQSEIDKLQFEYMRQVTKAIAGMLIISGMLALMMAESDDEEPLIEIFGGGPTDYKKNAQWRATGARPYTIRIAGRTLDYRPLPWFLPLSALGRVWDSHRFEEKEDRENPWAGLLFGTLVGMTDQSFLNSIGDLMDAIQLTNDPDEQWNKIVRIVSQPVSTVIVPGANFWRQAERMIDPTVRTTNKDLVAGFLAQVPVVNQTLEDRVTVLGSIVERDRPIIDTFPLIGTPDPVSDPEERLIMQYVVERKAWLSVPSPTRTTVITSNLLTDGEEKRFEDKLGTFMSVKEYNAYMVERGQRFKQLFFANTETLQDLEGEPAREYLGKLMLQASNEAKRVLLGLGPKKPSSRRRTIPRLYL